MKIYQIDYDLRNPQRNYEDLYKRIKSYGSWCHPLESTWLISTDQSAAQVHSHLFGVMDRDDGLLVTRLTGEAAWIGIDAKVSDWLKSELNRLAA